MRRILAGALLALGGLLMAPLDAHAGTYDVWACQDPNGKAVVADGWARTSQTTPNALYSDGCQPGGAPGTLFARQSGGPMAPNSEFSMGFKPPEGQSIAAYALRYRTATPFDPGGTWSEDFTVFENDTNFSIGANIKTTCWGTNGCGGGETQFSGAPGRASALFLFLNCNGTGGRGECPGTVSGQIELRQAKVSLTDDADPAFVGAPSGPLVGGTPVSGVATSAFTASDVGGGVARVVAEVDGRELGATDFPNDGACVVPYSLRQPCKPQAAGEVAVDTRWLTDGAHSLRLLAYDATRTNVAAFGPVPLTVSNGPQACAATSDPKVRARVGKGKTRVTVRYGRGATVTGTVKTAAGAPVAGATVTVSAGRTGYTTVAAVTTGADGRFTAKVPAGTSRRVFALVRQGDAAPACSGVLRVNTRAKVTLRAVRRTVSSRGAASFRGRVSGERRSRATVVLQGYDSSSKRWRTVGTARVSRTGRIRARYSVRGGRAGTFRFRALVRAARAYPYAAGTSKTVRVRAR